MQGVEQALRGYLDSPQVDLAAIRTLLDGASHQERLSAVRGLGKADQKRLYAAAEGFASLRLADLVPPETPDMTTVRHHGRNTLPAFSLFEKRFCRPPALESEPPEVLYGFNHQSVSWLTGPGYYIARDDPVRGEVCIDYHEVPPSAPAGWPPIRSNEAGLSRLVYGFMIDTLRRLSTHVSVGRAARRGRDMDSWFVLCREA